MVRPGDDNAVLAVPAALWPAHEETPVVDRETVQSDFRAALDGMLDGDRPHLFVVGPRGVGKSLLTRRVVDERGSQHHRSVFVSCDEHGSAYGVAVALANALDPTGQQYSRTGHSKERVMRTLADRLAAAEETIVVLDEVDTVGRELLSTVADATVGDGVATVCVSNDPAVRNDLAVPVRRRLCARELVVGPYDAAEVRQILRSRATAAFHDDAITPEALDRCTELVRSTFDGDIGQGVELLSFVAIVADEDGAERATVDHVERARDRLVSHRVRETLDDGSPHRRRCLQAVFDCTAEGSAPRIGTLYERYRAVCDTEGVQPISERGVHDHLGALREAGFVTVTSHRTGEPGHYYRYDLGVERAAARLALAALGE